jgi:hypothetical protein
MINKFVSISIAIVILGMMAGSTATHQTSQGQSVMEGKEKLSTQSTAQSSEFMLEAFVNFPDDALQAVEPIIPQHIDAMMAALQRCGVRRVSWDYYGDGHWRADWA